MCFIRGNLLLVVSNRIGACEWILAAGAWLALMYRPIPFCNYQKGDGSGYARLGHGNNIILCMCTLIILSFSDEIILSHDCVNDAKPKLDIHECSLLRYTPALPSAEKITLKLLMKADQAVVSQQMLVITPDTTTVSTPNTDNLSLRLVS